MSRLISSAALLALLLLAACTPNPYYEYYMHSQSSPTTVGSTTKEPLLVNCGEDSSDLMYRTFMGKGYDPVGYAVFTYDSSLMKDNPSLVYAQATNVFADLATYTVCKERTMHEGSPHATEIYEYKAVFWQKSLYTPLLGGECRELTEQEINEYKVNGILVTAIRPRSPGFKGDVRVGDIIVEANGRQMASLEIFREAISANMGRTVELKLQRGNETVMTKVNLEANR